MDALYLCIPLEDHPKINLTSILDVFSSFIKFLHSPCNLKMFILKFPTQLLTSQQIKNMVFVAFYKLILYNIEHVTITLIQRHHQRQYFQYCWYIHIFGPRFSWPSSQNRLTITTTLSYYIRFVHLSRLQST